MALLMLRKKLKIWKMKERKDTFKGNAVAFMESMRRGHLHLQGPCFWFFISVVVHVVATFRIHKGLPLAMGIMKLPDHWKLSSYRVETLKYLWRIRLVPDNVILKPSRSVA